MTPEELNLLLGVGIGAALAAFFFLLVLWNR